MWEEKKVNPLRIMTINRICIYNICVLFCIRTTKWWRWTGNGSLWFFCCISVIKKNATTNKWPLFYQMTKFEFKKNKFVKMFFFHYSKSESNTKHILWENLVTSKTSNWSHKTIENEKKNHENQVVIPSKRENKNRQFTLRCIYMWNKAHAFEQCIALSEWWCRGVAICVLSSLFLSITLYLPTFSNYN